MEVAIAAGLAAVGYGLGNLFPKASQPDPPTEARLKDSEELGPVSTDVMYGPKIVKGDAIEYTVRDNLDPIDPENDPGEVRAANDDSAPYDDGLAGVTLNPKQPFITNQPGTFNDEMLGNKAHVMTGAVDNPGWYKKEEQQPMFDPKVLTHVSGAPVQLDQSKSFVDGVMRQTPVYNNVGPTDRLLVGPGLGLDPDVPAANGYHDPVRINPYDPSYKKNQFGGRVLIQRPPIDKPTLPKQLGIYKRSNIEVEIDERKGIATHKTDGPRPQVETFTVQDDGHRNNLSKKGLEYNETGVAHRGGSIMGGYNMSGFEEILTQRDVQSEFTAPARGLDSQPDGKIGDAKTPVRPDTDYMGVARGSDNFRGKKAAGSVKDRQDYEQYRFDLDLAANQLDTNEIAIRPFSEVAAKL